MNINCDNIMEYISKGLYVFFLILVLIILLVSIVSLIVSFFSKNDEKLKLVIKRFIALAIAAVPVVLTNVWGITPVEILNSGNNETIISETLEPTTNITNDDNVSDTALPMSTLNYSELEVVIVIDQSISMQEYSDPNKIALDVACSFVDLCKNAQKCMVSVISFADKYNVVCENKNVKEDSVSIKNNIRDIEYNLKKTNITDALEAANNILQKKYISNSKEIILLISDGRIDVGSQTEDEKLRKTIINNLNNNHYCCPIYTIGLNSNSEYPVDIDLLQQIANKTDGDYKIIDTQKSFSNINDPNNNIFLFLLNIINKYLGTKTYISKNVVNVSPGCTMKLDYDNVPYSTDMNLIVFCNPDVINVNSTSYDEIVSGNNYIIVNSLSTNESYTVSSTEETQILYAFVYYFDVSIEYAISQNLIVGEPIIVSGKLMSNLKITSKDIIPYLYVSTESDFLAGSKFEKKYLLEEDSGSYMLPEEYVFSQPGTYYCKVVLEADGSFVRSSNYVKVRVAEPSIFVSSAEKIHNNLLNLTVQLCNNSGNESIYSLNEKTVNNFDIKLSTDDNDYKKAELTQSGFNAELQCFQTDMFDLYTEIVLKDSVNILYGEPKYSKSFVMNNNKINNSAPYLIGDNYLEETVLFRFLNNTTKEIPLNDFFNDDSSDYKIIIKSASIGTDIQFNENDNSLIIASNDIGTNKVVVCAVDIENPNMKSEDFTINFDIIFFLSKLNITISIGFITSFIAIVLNRRIKYGKIQLTILLDGESIEATFKGKSMKVSRLLKNHTSRKYFRRIKIRRISNKTFDIKQKGSKKLIDPSINSFNIGFYVQGTSGYRLWIKERKV